MIARHRLANDPVTSAAMTRVDVGSQQLVAISDGCLVMRPDMVGSSVAPTAAHDVLAAMYGEARLPVGCFVVPGDINVLIDTGVGPIDAGGAGRLVGGNLIPALGSMGLAPGDIDVVALTHLHGDHSGTIGDQHGEPVFSNARHVVGSADWEYFVVQGGGPVPVPDHTRAALFALDRQGALDLVDGDLDVTSSVRRIAAPGHTPGHALFSVHDRSDRVLVLGDAMYCPQQLTELEWSVAWDVDPALARRTRDRLVRDLDEHGGAAVGCHFPELSTARLLT